MRLAAAELRHQPFDDVLVILELALLAQSLTHAVFKQRVAVARPLALDLVADGGSRLGQLRHIGRHMPDHLGHHRTLWRAHGSEDRAIGQRESFMYLTGRAYAFD